LKTRFKGSWIPLILLWGCSVYTPDLLKGSISSAGSSGTSLGGDGVGGKDGNASSGKDHGGEASGTGSMGGMIPEGGMIDVAGGQAGAGGEQPGGTDWLHVEGNKILHADGTRFRGRGVSLYDTRQCGGCAWTDPGPVLKGVMRRIDIASDDWGANLIRLNLSSFADDAGGSRVQWDDVLGDASYADDLVSLVNYIGTKSSVYVMIGIHEHPSLDERGLPTIATLPVWRKISTLFKNAPYVMYAVAHIPLGTMDDKAWTAMNDVIDAIRSQETTDKQHLIAVTGMQTLGDPLAFFRTKPMQGENIIYAVTVSAHADTFQSVFLTSAQTLPTLVTGFGPLDDDSMTLDDSVTLMQQAETHEVPYIGSSFAVACGAPLMFTFQDGAHDCRAAPVMDPSPWGDAMKKQLATPWASMPGN
jgi:hypothetical protein